MHRTTHLLLALLCLFANDFQAQTISRGPYLQSVCQNQISVRWRTSSATSSKVWYGTTPDNLTETEISNASTTEHEVFLTDLLANTTYYYAIGNTNAQLAGGTAAHYFKTSPLPLTGEPINIWALGDAGKRNENQRSVRDAFYNYNGGAPVDLLLTMGDNAYSDGTDSEFQDAWFENMYEDRLINMPLFMTYGNHDAGSADGEDGTGVYFDIFTMPTDGSCGGVASGNESFYSFNYGDVHFVSINSYDVDRSPDSEMVQWLASDLAANTQIWTIVNFHHPVYDGRYDIDSDNKSLNVELRESVVPIFDQYGVDLVLMGHSHTYQRSYLIDGHYGMSPTFDPATMGVNMGDGQLDGDGAYQKVDGKGVVYVIAGTAGTVNSTDNLDHPVMYHNSLTLGSFLLEINHDQLDGKFLTADGIIDDYFTITKDIPPVALVTITNPLQGFAASQNVIITTEVSENVSNVSDVEFFYNEISLGSDESFPFTMDWTIPASGEYDVEIIATTDFGVYTDSVHIVVGSQMTCQNISASTDDATQSGNGDLSLSSPILNLVTPNSLDQGKTGLRFSDMNIPQGAIINSAFIEFTPYDDVNVNPCNLTIHGYAYDDVPTFANGGSGNNVNDRPRTSATVNWSPNEWTANGEIEETIDLSTIVQEIVDRPGFTETSAIGFILEGTGNRRAFSFDSAPSSSPKLCVEYTLPYPPDSDGDGTPDSEDVCNGSLEPGTLCDDNNSATFDDVITIDCNCEGMPYDCPSLMIAFGTPCDDNNTATYDDVVTTDCVCAGTPFDCPVYLADIGTPCDDNNENTYGETLNADCLCVGLPISNVVTSTILILDSSDDAEEAADGSMDLNSSDLEMVEESTNQTIGLRYALANIPEGAFIVEAFLQFGVDEIDSEPTTLNIRGERSIDVPTYNNTNGNITSRLKTSATVTWEVEDWLAIGEMGQAQKSPDLSSIIQEIVEQPNYSSSTPIAFIIDGFGKRVALSRDKHLSNGPELIVTYGFLCSDFDVDGICDQDDLCPDSPGSIGEPCDDGNPSTTNDTYNDNCDCIGFAFDCPDLSANIGGSCNDNNTGTYNDVVDANCNCIGTAYECPNEMADIGSACDDNNPATYNDLLNADCNCIGTLYECPNLLADIGSSCNDNNNDTTNDIVNNNCQCEGELITGSITVSTKVNASSDDAEEKPTGYVTLTSTDLEMTQENSTQVVGIRFVNTGIPADANIVSAYIQFSTDEAVNQSPTNLNIFGQADNNPPTFSNATIDISSRPKTTASSNWQPSEWNQVGQRGLTQRTSDLSNVVQELVNQTGYTENNAMVFIIEGFGKRVAESYDGSSQNAAELVVTYSNAVVVYDCPVLQLNIGSSCDDNNSNTSNDVVTSDCDCMGTVGFDCPALQLNVGASCDDNNLNTSNDIVTSDCECIGTVAYDCPALQLNVGASCDDNNSNTSNDIVTSDCECIGTVAYDCPTLQLNIGSACDDNNLNTSNDIVTSDCECIGTIGYDCPTLELNVGASCDDNNLNTSNDVVTSDCNCEGQPSTTTTTTVTFTVESGNDDAEEKLTSGNVRITSSDLEMAADDGVAQMVGIRFKETAIPLGAVIESAYIQFTSEDNEISDPCILQIYGEANGHSDAFEEISNNISSRNKTAATVTWNPVDEWEEGENGTDQKTVNIAAIVQEIIDLPAYGYNNPITVLIEGTGLRAAESYDGNPDAAAKLIVSYSYNCIDDDNDGVCNSADLCPNISGIPGTPCDDGDPMTFNDVMQDDCSCAGVVPTGFACSKIMATNDDAEEKPNGSVNLTSSDLELAVESQDQVIGLRFRNLQIPQGVTISSADIQFTVDEAKNVSPCELTIYGELHMNPGPFTTNNGNISGRVKTSTYLSWMPDEWPTVNESGANQQTVDIAPIIQEIVDQLGYTAGSSIVIIIEGEGTRTAESYDGDENKAAELCIEYDMSSVNNIANNAATNSNESETEIPTEVVDLKNSKLHVFPNPAKDFLTLRFDPHNVNKEAVIQIWDANGRLVHNEKRLISNGQKELRLNKLSLPNGGYTVQLHRGPFLKAAKFVVYK